MTQNISCVVREAEPENTTWICSYHFPPEPTDPGTGGAAEGLWASLAGQSPEGKDKAGRAGKTTAHILACPASLPPNTQK